MVSYAFLEHFCVRTIPSSWSNEEIRVLLSCCVAAAQSAFDSAYVECLLQVLGRGVSHRRGGGLQYGGHWCQVVRHQWPVSHLLGLCLHVALIILRSASPLLQRHQIGQQWRVT